MEGVLRQVAWWGVAGREQRPASGPGQPWVLTALASLGGLFFLPHVLPGRRWGMGSFRACCGLGRSSEFGMLV